MQSFRTEAGEIVGAVTADQMRELDRVAIEETGPNLFQMMENAGRNLASMCVEMLGEQWPSAPVVIVAGTGGNGGGGICAARHLANRGGDVTLVVSDIQRLSGVPAQQLALFRASGGKTAEGGSSQNLEASLTVDALLGYSLAGAPYGAALDLIEWMSQLGAPVLALDVPSGIDATSGDSPGAHVRAATTMTLALPKTGLAGDTVGELWVADIGIPRGVLEQARVPLPPASLFAQGYRRRLVVPPRQ
ncbi:hypothetical protein GCM10027020_05820 [Nocardioides salsibiostraticola]